MTLKTLVRSGDAAPGTDGAKFSSFGPPVRNDIGDVLFFAHVNGGIKKYSEGLFLISQGIVKEIVLANSFKLGVGTEVPNSNGSKFLRVSATAMDGYPNEHPNYSINSQGTIVFIGETTGGDLGQGPVSHLRALWRYSNGALEAQPLIKFRTTSDTTGTVAPGTGNGQFGEVQSPQIVSNGAIGFSAYVHKSDMGGDKKVTHGIFRVRANGQIVHLVLDDGFGSGGGTAVPGEPGSTFLRAENPSFRHGAGWFFVGVTTGGVLGHTHGVWHGTPQGLSEVVRMDPFGQVNGTVVPGTGGAEFQYLDFPLHFADGVCGFEAGIGGGTKNVHSGIFTAVQGGALTTLVLADGFGSGEGSAINPQFLPGTTFQRADNPAFNEAGDFVFDGNTKGGAVGFTTGLWGHIGGQYKLLLRNGGTSIEGVGTLGYIEYPVVFGSDGVVVLRCGVYDDDQRFIAELDTTAL